MQINEQNSLRVLVLAIALTLLGGATGIMFYASQQNESVLASETELIAAETSVICKIEDHKVKSADGKGCDCIAGYENVGGICIEKTEEPKPVTCPANKEPVDGECVCKEELEDDGNGGCKEKKEVECAQRGDDWEFKNGTCVPKEKICEDGEPANTDGSCDREPEKCPNENMERNTAGECICKDGYENDGNGGCKEVEKPLECSNTQYEKDGECVDIDDDYCKKTMGENYVSVSGSCVEIEEEPKCDPETGENCPVQEAPVCDGYGEILDEEKNECVEDNDFDGDGILNDEDRDMDGDGYLDKDEDLQPIDDDMDAKHYNVGDRDLLMFATLAYEPVDSNLDRISGDTKTENGKTVKENYNDRRYGADNSVRDLTDLEERDDDGNKYFDVDGTGYFKYVCHDKASWNIARDGENECMIKEDEMIGMQAQEYNEPADQLFKAWQVVGKDYYFGDDGGAERNGAGAGDNSYASVSEVDQWVIYDHVAEQAAKLFKRHSYMEATVFRLNNNYVLAYRGTDFPDLIEWFADFRMVPDGMSAYERTAKEYAIRTFSKIAEDYANDPEEYERQFGGKPNFYITGHSLGGYLTQVGAVGLIENGSDEISNPVNYLKGVVYFNGMGFGFHPLHENQNREFNLLFDWAQKTDENGVQNKVMCYNNKGDLISALGRHVNQTTYYAAEGAILLHARENVSKVQNIARANIVTGIANGVFSLADKAGDYGIWYNRLGDVKDYLKYYSRNYGSSFGWEFDENNILSSTGLLDLLWFCHEPSASLFYNISQGEKGYRETINITASVAKDQATLTAEINGDIVAGSYVWYRDGVEVAKGSSTYSFANTSGTEGIYSVSATIKSRKVNGMTREETVEGEYSFDKAGPDVSISTENDVWNLRSGETIKFIIRAYDKSGFVGEGADALLDLEDLTTFGIASSSLKIDKPILDPDNSDDNTQTYIVEVKSSIAGYLTLKVKDGAFKDGNGNKSAEAKSPKSVHFTIFEYNNEDKTGPFISISPVSGGTGIKGETLKYKIEAYDESGIESDDIEKNVDYFCTLGGKNIKFDGDTIYSDDKKTVSRIVALGCDDESKYIASFGTLTVKAGAFTDTKGNKSSIKTLGAIEFKSAPDRTGPFLKIDADNGYKGEYGGTLDYTLTVNDDSGVVALSAEELKEAIEFANISNGITVESVTEPSSNEENTIVSYRIKVTTNEHCSKYVGCGGTFQIKHGAFKDTVGNGSMLLVSGLILFASASDTIAPKVTVTIDSSRSPEVEDGIDFKVVAFDEGGIDSDPEMQLTADKMFVDGINNGASIVNISEPTYEENGKKVQYTVTVVSNTVSSGAKLVVKSGAFKDLNGNVNINAYSDIVMWLKKKDYIPPTVTITPVVGWNAIRGNSIKLRVTAVDEGGMSRAKTVTTKDFFMTKLITNDVAVDSVSLDEQLSNDSKLSYTVTLKADKVGKALLNVKTGTFKDASDNPSLLKVSDIITFEKEEDTVPPKVSITKVSNTSVKQGNKIILRLTVTDAGGISNTGLKKDSLKVQGNDSIKITNIKELPGNTANSSSWDITIEHTGSFSFIQLVKDAIIVAPKGLFKDGDDNQSNRELSPLVRFTRF